MATVRSSFCLTTSSIFSSSSNLKLVSRNYLNTNQNISRIRVIASSCGSNLMTQSSSVSSTAERTNFGFKNLTETFSVDVQRAEARPLNVQMNAPIRMGTALSLEKVENVAIRVELSNGCVGWGEVAVVPSVTAKNQMVALAMAKEACEFLCCSSPMVLNLVLNEIAGILPGTEFASVRAGVEMALIDAVANSIGVPLWRLFGGVSNTLTTAITLPSICPAEASELASKYCQLGFKTLKRKMEKNINAEIKILQAIQAAHPHCSFILDANRGYTLKEAIEVIQKLHDSGIRPTLLEQPVHRDERTGLKEISDFARGKYGMSVSVDESCESLIDVQGVIKESLADVINIKLAKFGVMGALEIIELARNSGLNLMISNAVETRLATGFAAHLAAGLGCFKFVSLDMPFLLSEDPVICGYEASGAIYKFLNARGQGGFLKWDFSSWLWGSLKKAIVWQPTRHDSHFPSTSPSPLNRSVHPSINAPLQPKKHTHKLSLSLSLSHTISDQLKMKKFSYSALSLVVVVLVVIAFEVRLSNAVNCSIQELLPCQPAITSSSPPSNICCVKLREQKPCLCGYLKNPSLKPYVSSPGAKRVANSCGVPIPTC